MTFTASLILRVFSRLLVSIDTEGKVYLYVCARLGYCQGQVKAVSDWLNPRHLEHLVT